MKCLIGLSVCIATMAAFGDDGDGFAPKILDSSFDDGEGAATKDVLAGDDDSDSARAAGSDEKEWQPRLMIQLQSGDDQYRTVREAYIDGTREPGSEPKVKYRERQVRVTTSPMSVIPTLYCDAISITVSKGGDTPDYTLECDDRIYLRVNGLHVEADSASFSDGKCELSNAELTHDGTTVTSEKMILSLPVEGVVTRDFGKPVSNMRLIPIGDPAFREGKAGQFELEPFRDADDETVSAAPARVIKRFQESEPSDILGLERRRLNSDSDPFGN